MSGFISALIKQRKEAKDAEPDTHGRLKEIIAIIKKYNYDDGITPEITVNLLTDMGPTFVKLGQIASQQSEYLPPEYCEALSKLRSKVAPMDIETVYAQIEKYLGKPVNELFDYFDDKPLGSASIAQVHKAKMFDGTLVAVKVRRPGVVDTVARDFALIEKIIDKFVKTEDGDSNIKNLIIELEHTSKIELDFTNEANNIDRFWTNNHEREYVKSPKCYRELTCEAVLTEDFAIGKEVSEKDYLETLGQEERERIAALLADNFASQVLVDGFYHADPHSGNVLITDTETGETGQEHGIEWIDFGMMGQLTAKQRQTLVDIVTNVIMQDAYGLKKTALQVATPKGEINHGSLLETCEGICGQYTGADFGDFDLGDLLGTVLGGLQGENFKVDPFLTNLARGIIAIEGTIKTISPNVNILNSFTSKVDIGPGFEINLENPGEMNPAIAMKLVRLADGLTDSSTKKAEALDMLEKGQIKVRTDFSFEEKAMKTVTSLAGYVMRGLLVIALFVGSCLLCLAASLSEKGSALMIIFLILGFLGICVSVFFTWRTYRNLKNGK